METQKQDRQCSIAIFNYGTPEVALGEGLVTETFLARYGYLNSELVSVLVPLNKEPFEAHNASVVNPLSVGVPAERALAKKQLRNTFLQLKTLNVLAFLEQPNENYEFLPLADDTIYVTDETAFNICKRNVLHYQNLYRSGKCLASLNSIPLTYAVIDKATVSTVPIPYDVPARVYDDALLYFFITPKVLNSGDIFSITLTAKRLRQLGLAKSELRLWFAVHALERAGKGLEFGFVSRENSTLMCQGSSNAYVVPHSSSSLSNLFFPNVVHEVQIAEIAPRSIFTAARILQNTLLSLIHGGKCKDLAVMISGSVGVGKTVIIQELALKFGMHLLDINCCHVSGDSSAATEKRIKNIINQSVSLAPSVLYLKNVDSLCKGKEGETELRLCRHLGEMLRLLDSPVLVVGTTTCSQETIDAELLRMFTYNIHIAAPAEEERRIILEYLMAGVRHDDGVLPSEIAKRCAGMLLGDLQALVSFSLQNLVDRTKATEESPGQTCSYVIHNPEATIPATSGSCSGTDVVLNCSDVDNALQKLIEERADDLDMPKVPQVNWSDVGGLTDAKREIMDTIQVPMQYPGLVGKGLRRSGILFYGPPGCGKTLLAKAVATELNLNFMAVKGPELLNMYVGQSEENVRNIFTRARTASPCIIFFDELDSLAPLRGRSGDSGGVMDRVVAQLLAELDGIHSGADIFVIGATNRPDLLDPALLRPGRFDKIIYVGISSTKEDRLRILSSILSKTNLDPVVQVEDIESCCPSGLTGADFASMCSDATVNAFRRKIRQLEAQSMAKPTDSELQTPLVGIDDFRLAIKSLIPSVSSSDLAKYESIRKSYK